jgi:hypothetical protein
MFVGTSIPGAMSSFWWNVGICSLMGATAGSMRPVTCALLAETMLTRQRGWVRVLAGGLGAAAGSWPSGSACWHGCPHWESLRGCCCCWCLWWLRCCWWRATSWKHAVATCATSRQRRRRPEAAVRPACACGFPSPFDRGPSTGCGIWPTPPPGTGSAFQRQAKPGLERPQCQPSDRRLIAIRPSRPRPAPRCAIRCARPARSTRAYRRSRASR